MTLLHASFAALQGGVRRCTWMQVSRLRPRFVVCRFAGKFLFERRTPLAPSQELAGIAESLK